MDKVVARTFLQTTSLVLSFPEGLDMDYGEGSPGDWFLARNSGRKQWEIDPSGSYATSEGKLLWHAPEYVFGQGYGERRRALLFVACWLLNVPVTG